jgi:hypothetical protein
MQNDGLYPYHSQEVQHILPENHANHVQLEGQPELMNYIFFIIMMVSPVQEFSILGCMEIHTR